MNDPMKILYKLVKEGRLPEDFTYKIMWGHITDFLKKMKFPDEDFQKGFLEVIDFLSEIEMPDKKLNNIGDTLESYMKGGTLPEEMSSFSTIQQHVKEFFKEVKGPEEMSEVINILRAFLDAIIFPEHDFTNMMEFMRMFVNDFKLPDGFTLNRMFKSIVGFLKEVRTVEDKNVEEGRKAREYFYGGKYV